MNKCPGKNNVIIGDGSTCTHNNCVLIGTNIISTEDYEIVVGNEKVSVSRKMTENEFAEIRAILISIAKGFEADRNVDEKG